MDRLQKAVARAKEKKSVAVPASNQRTFENVNYSETTVVEVSDEQLAAKRVIAGMANVKEGSKFSFLRTKVLSKMKANNWQTLAFCSPSYGQGKSTVAANIAVAMAMDNTQSVMLVDLDLHRPNLHNVFSIEPEYGLADVLRERVTTPEVLINPGIKRLTLVPGKGVTVDSSKWISDPNMHRLFAEFKARYKSRFVVYDMPALLKSDDTLKAIKNFDCAILVAEDGKNTGDEIRQSIQIVKQTNYIGYVLNKSGKT